MARQIIPVNPFDYVIFGGTGDLARRKLLPSLYQRDRDGQLPEEARLIGASRSAHTREDYQDFARKALEPHVDERDLNDDCVTRFLARLDYVKIDAMSDDGWPDLQKALAATGASRIRAYYLAVSPSLFGPIAERLDDFDLIDDEARLVIEKPIGTDLETARELNRVIGVHFREDQIQR